MSLRAILLSAAAVATYITASAAVAEELVPIAEVSHIHGIAFDPLDQAKILLATHFGIYRSASDGMAQIVSTDAGDYMGFTPHPTDAHLLLASGHPAQGGNMGVMVSKDGGLNWTELSTGASGPVDFHAITISQADPATMYGLYGGIQISRDGGIEWRQVSRGPEKIIDLAASAKSANAIYAGTVSGLWFSDDGAATWTHIGPDVPVTMVETTADGSLYAFYAGTGLFKADPTGVWSEQNSDLGSSDFLHLAIDPTDPDHLVAVTQDSLLLESDDGGKTWGDLRL